MIVCICHDVKDRQIKAAMARGMDSMQALQNALNVGTCCGCCEPMVNDLLEQHHANQIAPALVNQLAYAV